MSNKSADEIKEYILNISSYEAEVEINVISNKNQNKYKAKQQFVKEDNAAIQTRRAFFHQLKEVINKSDVIMIVLDARDPMV